jgi:DNA-binding transcriptional LysR family regulator
MQLMNISNDSLKAFLLTAERGSFTKASLELGLTQSALTQKIARLEDAIEASVFIRKSDGIELTPAGERLLIYSRQQLQLEEEFLQGFVSLKEKLSGPLRIAGYSSVLRSLIIPKLSSYLRKNPEVIPAFSSYEIPQLVDILRSNKADMIITDFFPHLAGVEEIQIGSEEFVLIESKKYSETPDVFLDNDPSDTTTQAFFQFQGQKYNGKRAFMGDVYGIIDGVAQGLGKAVMSRHLIESDSRFRIIKTPKKYLRPVVLSYYKQTYYPRVQDEARKQLLLASR